VPYSYSTSSSDLHTPPCTGQLKSHFKLDEEIPSDPDKLIQAFPQWLTKVAAKGAIRRRVGGGLLIHSRARI
jgi:hypothetical protein